MDFKDWIPLKLVNSELLSRVRVAYVFGKSGQEALMVTQDDDVFACGLNFAGCLGVVNEGAPVQYMVQPKMLPVAQPVKIPELCQKRVKGFSATVNDKSAFVCAYTYDGKLYSWGKRLSQTIIDSTPTLSAYSSPHFGDLKVLEVVCGLNHCCILTTCGKVFTFGCNDYGQLGRAVNKDRAKPELVGGELIHKMVVKVSCGAAFTVALLDNGQVYSWGHNNCGQLGLSSANAYYSMQAPTLIANLLNVKIENIACGKTHVLALSSAKELFTWGQYKVDQQRQGAETILYFKNLGRIIDIAASCHGTTSAVMTENHIVYVWGSCGGLNLIEPTITEFETVGHVFASIADPRVMPQPMTRQESIHLDVVGESIRTALGDAETSDLTIIVEDKQILVHKLILMLRSPYFKDMLKQSPLEQNANVLKIDKSYTTMYAYFHYIYTGKLETSWEEAFELWKIADEYHDLVLKIGCEGIIRQGVSRLNFPTVCQMAVKLGAMDVAAYCLSFANKHVGDLLQSPEFAEWDVQTYREFLYRSYEDGVFKQ